MVLGGSGGSAALTTACGCRALLADCQGSSFGHNTIYVSQTRNISKQFVFVKKERGEQN